MRRLILISLFCLIVIASPNKVYGIVDDLVPIDCAGGCILIEFKTSNVIYQQDADKRWPPASITKIMTAVVALEHGNLLDDIEFSENATKTEKSRLDINEGVKVPFYKLIEAMMVKSGNDAAVAIAEHISGSEEQFAKLMNKKAKELGMKSTNFKNASGLPDDDQYSTARDLSILAQYAMTREDIRQIVKKRQVDFISEDGTDDRTIYSTNRLLVRHPLMDGIKTGYTNAAKFCLAGSASFRDYRLISIVLGCERNKVWDESARLLDYGFEVNDPLYPFYREYPVNLPEEEISEEGS